MSLARSLPRSARGRHDATDSTFRFRRRRGTSEFGGPATILMVHDYPPVTGGGLALAVQELARLFGDEFRFLVRTSRLVDHFADDRGRVDVNRATGEPKCTVASPRHAIGSLRGAAALIVHWTFSFRQLSTLSLLLGPVLGRPTVCVIHTAPAHCDYNRIRRLPLPVRRLLLLFARVLLRRCQAVVALSATHAAALAEAGITPERILPLPVAPSRDYDDAYGHRAQHRGALTTIGIAGELSLLKGADALPALLQALTPEYAFRIAGRGPFSEPLARAVERLSPAQRARIVLSDRLEPARMPAFYREIDCLLVLSHTESQCRVALEAMLAGVVVVARPAGGIVDLIVDGKTGFLVDVPDPSSVRACLGRISENPEEAAAVRSLAREAARRAFDESRREWRYFLHGLVGRQPSAGTPDRRRW